MNPSSAGGRWGALMASRAYKQLMKLEADKSVVDVVHTKIDELRDGQFTMDNYSVIIGTADAIPIYRARMSNDLRIIYQVDIVPERSLQFDHQILKILCIDSRAHIDYNFWARVSSSLYQRPFGGEYKDRCIFRLPKDTTNNFIYLPAKYPHDDAMFTTEPVYLPDNYYEGSEDQTKGRADAHALGTVKAASAAGFERYIPVNKALYNSVRANVEVNLPILLDPLERAIVHNKSASIVIGRSGTGKTTALVYKMRAIHLQDQVPAIRQMVVTRSRVLAKHIEATFRSLIESASIANKTSSELSIMAEQYKERVDPAVIEFDNELDLREDLPPQFSLLEDSHFPLFISFDKLCSLLEGDLLEHEQKERGYQMSIRCDNIVDFKAFQFEYWPKFKSNLKLGLDPASVYSEIMGVIKGSSNAIKSPDGFLSRNEYLVGTTRKALCQLDAGLRTQIYNIFEHYKKIKGERFERDPADRIRPLLNLVTDDVIQSQALETRSKYLVDFLYVDEVQDNLMSDIHLLRSLCTTVQNTYWGGDTAQTVVAGSAFRIRDLGTYLFNESDSVKLYDSRPLPAFSRFDLTGNFRSHTGIVNCAASVIEALYKLFPESLDRTDPETARWRGPPPVAFKDVDSNISSFEQFLLGSSTSFGAQQAIIVRPGEIVEELSSRLAELCPVLSITDCKGLEFDDVLLYKFFSSSEIPEAWDFVHGSPLKVHRSHRNSAPPPFLCNDLKLLYVAITRARKRCWIWDHGHVYDAMQTFWLSQELIITASTSEMIGWGSTSSPQEWIEKGQEYFANGMYKIASSCFKRGGSMSKAEIAIAYSQMSGAKAEMLRGDSRESRLKLCKAAQALDKCGENEDKSKQVQSARHLRFHAATCLELAHKVHESAKMFVKAGHHERAIRALFRQGFMNDGTELLLSHSSKLGSTVEQELLDYCRSYYFNKSEYGLLPPLFKFDLEEQLSYARRNNFRLQLKFLLNEHKRFAELATICLEDRMLTDALDYYLKDFCESGRDLSLSEGAKVVFSYSEIVFGLESKKSAEPLKRLDIMIHKLCPYMLSLSPKQRREFNLFRKLLVEHNNVDWTWAESWHWDQSNLEERLCKTILVHLAINNMTWLNNPSSFQCFQKHLTMWRIYNLLVAPVIEDAKPSRLPVAQRLLGFKPSQPQLYINTHFIVSEESAVYECSKRHLVPAQRSSNGDWLFPATWVDKLVKDALKIPLDRRLRQIYHKFKEFCLAPTISSAHGSRAIAWSAVSGSVICPQLGFQDRLGIILLALYSMTSICGVLFSPEINKPSIPKLWIRSLFDTIYPGGGTIHQFDPIWLPDHQLMIDSLRTIIETYLSIAGSDLTPNTQFSSLAIGYSLAMNLEDLSHIGVKATRQKPVSSVPNQVNHPDTQGQSIGECLCSFFNWSDVNGLTSGISAISLATKMPIELLDMGLLVHIVELIACDITFHIHCTSTSQDRFSGLILPISWARLLAKRYQTNTVSRNTISLPQFVESIVWLSDELRFGQNVNRLIGEKTTPIKSKTIHVFNQRLCWCISLLLVNSSHPVLFTDPVMTSLIHVAGDRDKYCVSTFESPTERFSQAFDQASCLQILCQAFKREPIVMLSNERDLKSERKTFSGIRVINYSNPMAILKELK